jgi:hypothetical protein
MKLLRWTFFLLACYFVMRLIIGPTTNVGQPKVAIVLLVGSLVGLWAVKKIEGWRRS